MDTDSCGSSTSGGPEFRFGLRLFLVGCPDRIAGGRELARNALDLRRDPVERLPHAQALAVALPQFGALELLDRIVRVLEPLAEPRLELLVGHLDAELLGCGLEDELARDGPFRLSAQPLEQVVGRLARHRQIRLEPDTARLDLTG